MRSLTAVAGTLMLIAVLWVVTGTLQSRVTEPDTDRLVQFVTVTDGVSSSAVTAQELHVWRDHTSLFETVVARPLAIEPGPESPDRDARLMKGTRPLVVNGRLKRGATIAMANRQLAALLAASRRIEPDSFKGRISWTVRLLRAAELPRA